MNKQQIETLIEQQRKISDRNYMNYQQSGIIRYMRAHEKAEDLIELCQTALSVADIKDENRIIKANFVECATIAISLDHDGRWLDQANLDEVGKLIKMLATYGRMMGVFDPWR